MADVAAGAPPAGAELIPDDVQEEMSKLERVAQKKLIQRIMDDHEFGKRLMNDPKAALDESDIASEAGIDDEASGHYHMRSRWRVKCYYSAYYAWAHFSGGYWWF